MFEEGHQVIIIEIMSDVKERGPKKECQARVFGCIPLSFTFPEETFRVRPMDESITLNKPMHCYTQYLLSGQVPTLEYGKPIGHVLNEISNTT